MGAADIPSSMFSPFALSSLNRCWKLTLPQQRKVWEHLRTDQSLISILKYFKDRAVKMNKSDVLRVFDELTWTVMMSFEEQFHFLLGKKDAVVACVKEIEKKEEIKFAPVRDDRVDAFRKRAELLSDKLEEKEQAFSALQLESKTEISRLTRLLSEEEASHERTRKELQEKECEHNALMERLAALEADVAAFNSAAEEANLGRIAAEEMAANLTAQLDAANQAIDAAEQRAKEVIALSDASRAERDAALQDLRDKEAESDALRQQVQQLRRQTVQAPVEMQASNHDNDPQLQEEVEARTREIEQLMKRNQGLEDDLQRAQQEIDELAKSRQALSEENARIEALVQQMQINLDRKPEKTVVRQDRSAIEEELRRKLAERDAQVGQCEVEISRLQTLVTKLMAECSKKGEMSTFLTEEEAKTAQQAFRMQNVFNRLYEDARARHGRNAERLQKYVDEQMALFEQLTEGRMHVTFRVQRYALDTPGSDCHGSCNLVFEQVADGKLAPNWLLPVDSVENVVCERSVYSSSGRRSARTPFTGHPMRADRPQSAGAVEGRNRSQGRRRPPVSNKSLQTLLDLRPASAMSRSESMKTPSHPPPARTFPRAGIAAVRATLPRVKSC